MMVVRENLSNFEFAADVDRNAVGQAVTFVEARFVEFEHVEKNFVRLFDYLKIFVRQNVGDKRGNFEARDATVSRKIIQNFD